MTHAAHDIFSVLVREHSAMLLTYLRALVRDRNAVDDLFQETMLTAWRRFDVYDRKRPFAHWLRGIARKQVLAYARKNRRAVPCCDEELLEHLDQRLASIQRRPGDMWEDKIAALDECLEQLSQHHRQAIDLYYREDCDTSQIAQRLTSTREAIKKRLQRARTLLAECLGHKAVFQTTPKD